MTDTRPLWLIKKKRSVSGRAHVAFFVPNTASSHLDVNDKTASCLGTIIHVIGEPLGGFTQQFKRNCNTSSDAERVAVAIKLCDIEAKNIVDPENDAFSEDQTPKGTLDFEAMRVRPPPPGQNILSPIGYLSCQHWLVDYAKHLTKKSIIPHEAVGIVEAHMDIKVPFKLKKIEQKRLW